MRKLQHCGGALTKPIYEKTIKSDRPAWVSQVFIIFKCPKCKNELNRWHGIAADGSRGPLNRITAYDFHEKWALRLAGVEQKKEVKDTRAKCHTGEFTMKASRDPAQVFEQMKRYEVAL